MKNRAAEWGDLATSFLWKGRLRVVSKGKKCEIRLEDNSNGKFFFFLIKNKRKASPKETR